MKIVHKGSSAEETKFIYDFIDNKVREKSKLMREIQALKKIKSKEVQPIIDEIKSNVHNNYFEFKIADILKEFKSN